jgi:hypothetical protein
MLCYSGDLMHSRGLQKERFEGDGSQARQQQSTAFVVVTVAGWDWMRIFEACDM